METSARVKFENDQDFIDGTINMGEMLETWQKTADDGTIRTFELKPKSEDRTLEVFLKVTK